MYAAVQMSDCRWRTGTHISTSTRFRNAAAATQKKGEGGFGYAERRAEGRGRGWGRGMGGGLKPPCTVLYKAPKSAHGLHDVDLFPSFEPGLNKAIE